MSNKEERIVRLKSLDGKLFYLRFGAVAEYFVTGLFFRFISLVLAAVLVILTMANDPGRLGEMSITSIIISFSSVMIYAVAMIMIWLIVVGELLFALYKRGILTTIYTPFFYLPFVPVFLFFFWANGVQPFSERVAVQLFFFLFIFVVLDLAHAHFVAPLHARFVEKPDRESASGEEADAVDTGGALPPRPLQQASELQVSAGSSGRMPPQQETRAEALVALSHVEPADPVGTTIEIGNQTFLVDDIRWIESDDHYLKVQVKSKSIMVRANLSDVALHLHQGDGAQLNRSLWVSHNEIKDMQEAERGRLVVTLASGDTVKVPKMRKLLVKQSHALFLKRQDSARGE